MPPQSRVWSTYLFDSDPLIVPLEPRRDPDGVGVDVDVELFVFSRVS